LTAEQRKIQELEKKIRRIEMEKEILKKATVDSIDQSNTCMEVWVNGGSLNETIIHCTRKRIHF
jgi:transposase